MEWINELLWGEGVGHSILLLSVVIALGIQLGKLKLFGISLGITMVLFVGIFLGISVLRRIRRSFIFLESLV